MLINSRWPEETHAVSLESLEEYLNEGLPFISVSQSEDQDHSVAKQNLLLPLAFHFGYDKEDDEIESVLRRLFEKIVENHTGKSQVLLLLHRGEGLDRLGRAFRIRLEDNLNVQIKDSSFSGGFGYIYEYIVHNAGFGFAQECVDGGIQRLEDLANPKLIKGKSFEAAWNAYWNQSRKKFELFRRGFLTSQLLGFTSEETLKKEVQLVLDFITKNVNEIDPNFELAGANFNLANVRDLSARLDKLENKNQWIEELSKWADNEQEANMEIINLGFDDLIQRWDEE